MKTIALVNSIKDTISLSGEQHYHCIILEFVVEDEGARQDFRKVSFGYSLKQGSSVISEDAWPYKGMRFGGYNNGAITSVKIELEMETDYELTVWYKKQDVYREKILNFNSGRPPKRFESMIWNEEKKDWDFVKPYPENTEKEYIWNEEKLDWEEFDVEEYLAEMEKQAQEADDEG